MTRELWTFKTDNVVAYKFGILHSPGYTFFEKACIVELNADVETGNLKLGNASTSLCFPNFKFQVSNFTTKIQD